MSQQNGQQNASAEEEAQSQAIDLPASCQHTEIAINFGDALGGASVGTHASGAAEPPAQAEHAAEGASTERGESCTIAAHAVTSEAPILQTLSPVPGDCDADGVVPNGEVGPIAPSPPADPLDTAKGDVGCRTHDSELVGSSIGPQTGQGGRQVMDDVPSASEPGSAGTSPLPIEKLTFDEPNGSHVEAVNAAVPQESDCKDAQSDRGATAQEPVSGTSESGAPSQQWQMVQQLLHRAKARLATRQPPAWHARRPPLQVPLSEKSPQSKSPLGHEVPDPLDLSGLRPSQRGEPLLPLLPKARSDVPMGLASKAMGACTAKSAGLKAPSVTTFGAALRAAGPAFIDRPIGGEALTQGKTLPPLPMSASRAVSPIALAARAAATARAAAKAAPAQQTELEAFLARRGMSEGDIAEAASSPAAAARALATLAAAETASEGGSAELAATEPAAVAAAVAPPPGPSPGTLDALSPSEQKRRLVDAARQEVESALMRSPDAPLAAPAGAKDDPSNDTVDRSAVEARLRDILRGRLELSDKVKDDAAEPPEASAEVPGGAASTARPASPPSATPQQRAPGRLPRSLWDVFERPGKSQPHQISKRGATKRPGADSGDSRGPKERHSRSPANGGVASKSTGRRVRQRRLTPAGGVSLARGLSLARGRRAAAGIIDRAEAEKVARQMLADRVAALRAASSKRGAAERAADRGAAPAASPSAGGGLHAAAAGRSSKSWDLFEQVDSEAASARVEAARAVAAAEVR